MLSLACDYRVMTDGSSRNAWLSMNEVRFFLPHVMTTTFYPVRFILVLRGHCHSLPFYGLNLVTNVYTVKLLLKDIVTPQKRLCKTAS